MKTLKILTVVCLIALSGAVVFGAMEYSSRSGELYAVNPNENYNQTEEDEQFFDNAYSENEDDELVGYSIGDEATDFNLKDIDGSFKSLEDYPDAKGFIVIFTCNHCPYSKAYEDRIIAIDKEYKKKGYPVIAINPNNPELYPDDSFENMKIRAREKGFTFPYLFDSKQDIYPQYGATKTPHVFLLEKENSKNIVRYIGAIDDNHKDVKAVKNHFLKDALDALISGREIDPKTTVAIGCSIKK
ncbi:Peroxiredoxin [Nonlabens sp. Hel1_33_55]|uniref:thioredoxin family protein n=1 Tax=Nonlabens sp. Hel1_33_55 TaxID=1336802 RepID=UPI000875C551|nr:thioredoxin family protein [Nonlabens sp. Hel1_33_55]SCX88770.1 Peroxiredoxin [Nonlabens sp. Hel1_33_55]